MFLYSVEIVYDVLQAVSVLNSNWKKTYFKSLTKSVLWIFINLLMSHLTVK